MLVLTLALAASQVFATALDTYFQLAIMLMILMAGLTAFAHFRPFTDDLLQRMQVCTLTLSFPQSLNQLHKSFQCLLAAAVCCICLVSLLAIACVICLQQQRHQAYTC